MPVRSKLLSRGYLSLVVTQFFGAANDNILKGVLAFGVALHGIWSDALGDGGQAYVSLCLTVPFIFLSGFAGQVSDWRSKRTVTVIVKVAEVGIACMALMAFLLSSLWFAMSCMLLLAVQSTFFGPAKYGMIPELVEPHDLSRANGFINMMTNIAVIVGTLLAGPIYQKYYPASDPGYLPASGPQPLLWIPGVMFVIVAILGLSASLFIPRLPAGDPKLRFDFNPFTTYFQAIREMARSPLLMVALSWAFFYLLGMMALNILPDYKGLLNIDPTRASYLLGTLGIAIGIGSVVAGVVSGRHIEPRLVPVGAVGMTVGFVLLGIVPLNYWLVAGLLFGAGVFAGFYIVPLQSLLQYLSPGDERGRFLGTANAMSFIASTAGIGIFLLARKTFGMEANRIFLVCGVLAIVATGVLLWRMRRLIADPSLRKRSAEDVIVE